MSEQWKEREEKATASLTFATHRNPGPLYTAHSTIPLDTLVTSKRRVRVGTAGLWATTSNVVTATSNSHAARVFLVIATKSGCGLLSANLWGLGVMGAGIAASLD